VFRVVVDEGAASQIDALRELTSGERGEGTITYLVLDQQREVHVLVVHWLG
jgi:hypothetical protein